MRTFIFSRRFLIPFLLCFIGHNLYFIYEFSRLYKADFAGKGIPGKIWFEWRLTQALVAAPIVFLVSFLIGICCYTHYQYRKETDRRNPFSIRPVITILIIAIIGCWFVSVYVPAGTVKSRRILMSAIFTKPGEPFVLDTMPITKTVDMMSLKELKQQRDSLRKAELNTDNLYHDRGYRKNNIQIGKMTRYPFAIIGFYLLGVMLGITGRRIHVAFNILLAYFLLFAPWLYGSLYLERLYQKGSVGMFMGLYSTTAFLLVICTVWLWAIRKKLFPPKDESLDLLLVDN